MMNSEPLSSPSHEDKWQRMLALVTQHPTLSQPGLVQQFKKLIIRRLLAENMLVLLLQYTGLMFSTLTSPPSPIWFASGTACAFIFLRGLTILPGIWLGSFFAYYLLKISLVLSFSCATLYSLQALILHWLCYSYVSPTLIFYDRWTFLKFIFCSATLTCLASLMLVIFCYSSPQTVILPLHIGLRWWLANFNGLIIVACALMTLDAYFNDIETLTPSNLFQLKLYFGLLLIVLMTLLLNRDPLITIVCAISALLVTLMISLRFGWCGGIAALFVSGIAYGIGASISMPLFSTTFSSASVLFLQSLLCSQTIFALLIALKNETSSDDNGIFLSR